MSSRPTNFGHNILYHNNGDGTFTDVTNKAGVGASGWSMSAAFADFDGDGLLDLFVVRYLDLDLDLATEPACVDPERGIRIYCLPMYFPSVSSLVFHNNGDGTFTDVTRSSGIGAALGKGLGVVVADVDGDGRPDIYVANDTTPNFLFRNRGGGKFEEVSLASGVALSVTGRAFGGMGANAGDLHGDGRLDLVVANFEKEPNSLFRNRGAGVFEDVSEKSGFGAAGSKFVAFGLNLLDAGNRGHLDAFVTNGHVQESPRSAPYAQNPRLLWNDGAGHFKERGCGAPFARALVGRGSATADFDNDGAMDIAVSNSGGPLQLLHNEGKHGGWVGFVLRGTKSNRQGIGARIRLLTTAGRQVREVKAGEGYLSSSDPRVHFGLGDATIQSVEIRWPSGIVQQVDKVRAGRYQVVTEPATVARRRK